MKIGDRVTYVSFGKREFGIVKSLSDTDHVFVVYNCAGNWDRYFDYTAARTEINDLLPGWQEECAADIAEQNGHIAQQPQHNMPTSGVAVMSKQSSFLFVAIGFLSLFFWSLFVFSHLFLKLSEDIFYYTAMTITLIIPISFIIIWIIEAIKGTLSFSRIVMLTTEYGFPKFQYVSYSYAIKTKKPYRDLTRKERKQYKEELRRPQTIEE